MRFLLYLCSRFERAFTASGTGGHGGAVAVFVCVVLFLGLFLSWNVLDNWIWTKLQSAD